MSQHSEKGRALEYAVHRIEQSILAHDPRFEGAAARIELNKVMVVDGVRHEIDLWVVLNEGTSYATVHILECKNWIHPVGTEEVSKLVMKRDQVHAHTASLIAPKFTEDAMRLAQKFQVQLSVVTDFPRLEIQAPIVSHEIESGQIRLSYSQPDPKQPTNLSFGGTLCCFAGRVVRIGEVIDLLVGAHLQDTTAKDPRKQLPGPHLGRTNFRRPFGPGELTIEGFEVSRMNADLVFTAEVHHPTITARFSVSGRGGFFKLEYPPGTMGHERVSLEVATKPLEEPFDTPHG